jgi:hypothetical protein
LSERIFAWPTYWATPITGHSVSQSTEVRFSGRQLWLRYDGVNSDDWRVGSPRLDVVSGGMHSSAQKKKAANQL